MESLQRPGEHFLEEKKNSSKVRTTAVTFSDPHGLLSTVYTEMLYVAKIRETNQHTQQATSLEKCQDTCLNLLRRVHQIYQPFLVTSEYIQKHNHNFLHYTSQRASSSPQTDVFTCLIAVTVMTKKSGRPLVTGLVGVSTITCRDKTYCCLKPAVSRRKKNSGSGRKKGAHATEGVSHSPAEEEGAHEKDQHRQPQEYSPLS